MKTFNSIIDKAISHYDDLIKDWRKDPSLTLENSFYYKNMPNNNTLIENGKVNGILEYTGMPEPYFGDPRDCSAVIVNLNPGQTIPTNCITQANCARSIVYELDTYIKKGEEYSDMAVMFPYLNPASSSYSVMNPSVIWWQARNEWIKHIIKSCGYEVDEDKRPFAIEICPWHSYKWVAPLWRNRNNQTAASRLQSDVKEYVIAPACEILKNKNSVLPFGLIIGSGVFNALKQVDFTTKSRKKEPNWEIVQGMQWDSDIWKSSGYQSSWPNTKNKSPFPRSYALITNGEEYFLCTWMDGFNKIPEDFEDIEVIICNKIMAYLKRIGKVN